MSAIAMMIGLSLVLGLAAGGAVWFGWELVQNLVAGLHVPKAPPLPAPKPPEPPPADLPKE